MTKDFELKILLPRNKNGIRHLLIAVLKTFYRGYKLE